MHKTIRFGVSLDHHLLEKFDQVIRKKNYATRSEALRDLIRQHLVETEWEEGKEVLGTLTLVYDHDVRELGEVLAHLQHRYNKMIKSTLHVHLDHHNCLEVLVVHGRGEQVQQFADRLIGIKGVKHGRLSTTTTGRHMT